MKSGKLAIVMAEQSISWISCQSISPNLRKAYELATGGDASFFGYPPETSRIEMLELARRILKSRPSCIVFLDHLPHPAPLIHALDTVRGEGTRPKIAFHVYGDFTLYPFQWMSIDLILRGYEVGLITASPRQTALVANFLRPRSASVFTAGFPVDSRQFFPSAKVRAGGRRFLKLGRHESAIVYTGRLSMQKNSLQMIRIIGNMMARLSPHAHFFIAGPVDDLGVPLFKRKDYSDDYQTAIEAGMLALPGHVRHRTHLLGNLGASNLVELYNAADVFISPSLHHDEDFGMAPAEALMCGVPSVITDWGGYSQFVEQESDGYRIPVKLRRSSLAFDAAHFQKAAFALSLAREPFARRLERGERYAAKYSIPAIARTLSEIHDADFMEFAGFSPLMARLREAHRGNRIPFPRGPKKGTLYEKVYSAYLG